MSKNDEFESLIHNFKLDDVQPEETPPVRRQAFDYDKDAQRHMVSGSVPRAAASAPASGAAGTASGAAGTASGAAGRLPGGKPAPQPACPPAAAGGGTAL